MDSRALRVNHACRKRKYFLSCDGIRGAKIEEKRE